MIKKNLKIKKSLSGKPIDLALVEMNLGLSRRKIRRILDFGGIALNSKRVRVASVKVFEGDTVTLSYSEDTSRKFHPLPHLGQQSLIWNQNDLIAINKPPLLASVPTKNSHTPHVAKLIKETFPQWFSNSVFPCHRLDKETSGVMLLAKNEKMCDAIMDLFKNREIKKEYLALCSGIAKKSSWTVECHLSPIDKKTGMVNVVKAGGKISKTSFETIDSSRKLNMSLLVCRPLTGRSHQIRVHLAKVSNLPIIGDKRYDPNFNSSYYLNLVNELASLHHMLHAWRLELQLPNTLQTITLEAALPTNMKNCLKLAEISLSKAPQNRFLFT